MWKTDAVGLGWGRGGRAERHLRVLGKMTENQSSRTQLQRAEGTGIHGFHQVVLGMDGGNGETDGKIVSVHIGWVWVLLVHPLEATNALTFINLRYCRCVCVRMLCSTLFS